MSYIPKGRSFLCDHYSIPQGYHLQEFTGAYRFFCQMNKFSHYNCSLVKRDTCDNRQIIQKMNNIFQNSHLNFWHLLAFFEVQYSCVFLAICNLKPRSTNFLKFQLSYLKIKLFGLLKTLKSCSISLSRTFKRVFDSFQTYNVTELQGLPFF